MNNLRITGKIGLYFFLSILLLNFVCVYAQTFPNHYNLRTEIVLNSFFDLHKTSYLKNTDIISKTSYINYITIQGLYKLKPHFIITQLYLYRDFHVSFFKISKDVLYIFSTQNFEKIRIVFYKTSNKYILKFLLLENLIILSHHTYIHYNLQDSYQLLEINKRYSFFNKEKILKHILGIKFMTLKPINKINKIRIFCFPYFAYNNIKIEYSKVYIIYFLDEIYLNNIIHLNIDFIFKNTENLIYYLHLSLYKINNKSLYAYLKKLIININQIYFNMGFIKLKTFLIYVPKKKYIFFKKTPMIVNTIKIISFDKYTKNKINIFNTLKKNNIFSQLKLSKNILNITRFYKYLLLINTNIYYELTADKIKKFVSIFIYIYKDRHIKIDYLNIIGKENLNAKIFKSILYYNKDILFHSNIVYALQNEIIWMDVLKKIHIFFRPLTYFTISIIVILSDIYERARIKFFYINKEINISFKIYTNNIFLCNNNFYINCIYGKFNKYLFSYTFLFNCYFNNIFLHSVCHFYNITKFIQGKYINNIILTYNLMLYFNIPKKNFKNYFKVNLDMIVYGCEWTRMHVFYIKNIHLITIFFKYATKNIMHFKEYESYQCLTVFKINYTLAISQIDYYKPYTFNAFIFKVIYAKNLKLYVLDGKFCFNIMLKQNYAKILNISNNYKIIQNCFAIRLELQFSLDKKLNIFNFLKFNNILHTQTEYSVFYIKPIYIFCSSMGYGVRYNTPFGIFQYQHSFPLILLNRKLSMHFSFSISSLS